MLGCKYLSSASETEQLHPLYSAAESIGFSLQIKCHALHYLFPNNYEIQNNTLRERGLFPTQECRNIPPSFVPFQSFQYCNIFCDIIIAIYLKGVDGIVAGRSC